MGKKSDREIEHMMNAAVTAHRAGRLNDAERGYREILEDRPRHVGALRAMSALAQRAGDYLGAVELLERAVAAAPKDPNIRFSLAQTQRQMGWNAEAVRSLEKTQSLAPGEDLPTRMLAEVQLHGGFPHDALATYDSLLAQNPDDGGAIAGKALAMARTGDAAGAQWILEPLLRSETGESGSGESGSGDTQVRMLLAAAHAEIACRAGVENPDTIADVVLPAVEADTEPRTALYRAEALQHLGQLFERAGRIDEAFDVFGRAHEQRETQWPAEAHENAVQTLIDTYTPELVAQMRRSHESSDVPVFVVGVPRSGGSLVERIIDAHPQAAGAGEILDLWSAFHRLQLILGRPGYGMVFQQRLTQRLLDDSARHYVGRVRKTAKKARRITDKTPTNLMNLGFVAQLLPGARIIRCRRDPMDLGLACYSAAFRTDLPQVRSLETLGRYIRSCERLLDHFQQVLDVPMLEVQYEELVADPASHARRIIEFLDLEWDDAVAAHDQRDLTLPTASGEHAIGPVHQDRVGRAAKYGDRLAPLAAALKGEAAAAS
jgi:tetratricopeptide (TPR) repeat protein